jgi:2-(1,2-epoxy-1,2-dihydrophenyl)acetyl-CoA isomerase
MVICTDRARFAQIFGNIGLCPDAGAVWLLSRQLGTMRAKEIVYSGRMVLADEAVALGLALERTLPEDLMRRARDIAATFTSAPPLALGMAKRQFGLAPTTGFDQFLDAEYAMQPAMSQTEDHREGVAAFREKRKPRFQGL